MVFDLRRALLKEEEFESARLAAFEFKHRARTLRPMARAMGIDEDEVAGKSATIKPAELNEWLAGQHEVGAAGLAELEQQCSAEARKQLIAEIGDPTPHRLL